MKRACRVKVKIYIRTWRYTDLWRIAVTRVLCRSTGLGSTFMPAETNFFSNFERSPVTCEQRTFYSAGCAGAEAAVPPRVALDGRLQSSTGALALHVPTGMHTAEAMVRRLPQRVAWLQP
eukprot:2521613-Pleurochrysis_carterae.AAC.2